MGLDIYFYKGKRSAYNEYCQKNNAWRQEQANKKPEEIDYDSQPCIEDYINEEGYFRKVNFLVAFFDYEDNCSYKEITKDELEILMSNCKEVLDKRNEQISFKLLPTTSGFFFGGIDYDDYYYNDVERVYHWVKELLPTIEDDDVILMYCWW